MCKRNNTKWQAIRKRIDYRLRDIPKINKYFEKDDKVVQHPEESEEETGVPEQSSFDVGEEGDDRMERKFQTNELQD